MEWSWVEIGIVALAAIIMAGDEALNRAPNLGAAIPRLRGTARFIPAILISIAAILFVVQKAGLLDQGQEHRPTTIGRSVETTPPPAKTTAQQQEVAEKDRTIRQLNLDLERLRKDSFLKFAKPRRDTDAMSSAVYMNDLSIDAGYDNNPLSMRGIIVIGGLPLRVAIDYRPDFSTTARVKVGEINDSLRGESRSVQLVSVKDEHLWWGDPADNHPLPSFEDATPVNILQVRIVIIGPSNQEQHYSFILLKPTIPTPKHHRLQVTAPGWFQFPWEPDSD